MGQCSIPLAEAEGQPVEGWFTLLPRKGKGDMVSGKVRIQVTLTIHGEHGKGKHTSATFRSTVSSKILHSLDEPAIKIQEVLFRGDESHTVMENDIGRPSFCQEEVGEKVTIEKAHTLSVGSGVIPSGLAQ